MNNRSDEIKANQRFKSYKNLKSAKNSKEASQRGQNSLQGGSTMNAMEVKSSLFDRNIVGYRELRNKISEVFDSVTSKFNVVISGNVKKNYETSTAAIISTTILHDILSVYKFNTEVGKDGETGQYEAIQNEIRVYGCGDTREEAIDQLIDMVIDSTEDYFENAEVYARIPEMRKKYPYYLRINQCQDKEELLKVLNLS